MPITTLSYEAPVKRPAVVPELDFELLERAETLAQEGNPRDAVLEVFRHFFPGTALPALDAHAFTFTQGSSRVSTRFDGDDLVVTVPLVKLPEGGRAIAAMRYLLERTSAVGQLYQPRLDGTDVRLEHRDRLSRFHPAKLVEVLRRMPQEADRTDDWLVAEFGATALDPAAVESLTDEELARAQQIWQTHWREVDELFQECRRKRSLFFLNEVTAYTINNVSALLPLSGVLATRINQMAGTFNDSQQSGSDREASLGACIKEMKAASPEKLAASLSHATYAIAPKRRGDARVVVGLLGPGDYMARIDSMRKSEGVMDAALALVSSYVYLLGAFTCEPEIAERLHAGLTKACGKPFRELAKILFDDATELAKDLKSKLEEDEEEEEDEEGAA